MVTFRPAVREEVGLLIGLAGPSGSGKTMSAMKLASGIVGKDKPFCVIDTESRRALHYADYFNFMHGELRPPFRPENYIEAIKAADKEGFKAIVVDSASHEWAGEGGILDWQEEELTRMAGDNWGKREQCKMAAWIKPKMEHKKFVQALLQVRAHIILCYRAEEKIEMKKNDKGKIEIVKMQTATGKDGWVPISEKNLPYEHTVSFLLLANNPGYPIPIKLQEQHKILFPLDKPIDDESGRLIAEWAKGGGPKKTETPKLDRPPRESMFDALTAAGLSKAEIGDLAGFIKSANEGQLTEEKMVDVASRPDVYISEWREARSTF
jgi:hypothetical protein